MLRCRPQTVQPASASSQQTGRWESIARWYWYESLPLCNRCSLNNLLESLPLTWCRLMPEWDNYATLHTRKSMAQEPSASASPGMVEAVPCHTAETLEAPKGPMLCLIGNEAL